MAASPQDLKAKGDRALFLVQSYIAQGCDVSGVLPQIKNVKPLGDSGKIHEADVLLDEVLIWFQNHPCGASDTLEEDLTINKDWTDLKPVVLRGYDGDAMEPFISRDGQYLFFNDDKSARKEKDIYWAKRVSDYEYIFMGQVENVNSDKVDGVPTMDRDDHFYFISAKKYGFFNKKTVYRGYFDNGTVKDVESVDGLSLGKMGWLNMDIEISHDGQTLYATQTQFGRGGGMPKKSYFFYAKKQNKKFVPQANSDEIFKTINGLGIVYAAAITKDEKEIMFTRFSPHSFFQSFVAKRPNKHAPFGEPELLEHITGYAEAPAYARDDNMIIFHKKDKESGKFRLYALHRKK